MKISFHADPVNVKNLCDDLKNYGCVYWSTTPTNFKSITEQIDNLGIDVIPLCARTMDDFLYFLVRTDLVTDSINVQDRAAKVIADWQQRGEPAPDVQNL